MVSGGFSLQAVGQDSPRDRARAVLALRSAAGQVMDEMNQRASTQSWDAVQMTESVASGMLKDPAAHRRIQESRSRSRSLAEKLQRAALETALSNAVAEAQARSPLPIRREDVLELVGPSWSDQVSKTLALFMSNQFDSVFVGARLRAVALQQKSALDALRFPESGELDARMLALWQEHKNAEATLEAGDFDKLGGWLKTFAAPKTDQLLEEVERQIGDAAGRRKDEIHQQYSRQIAVLQESVAKLPRQFILQSDMAGKLMAATEADYAERKQAARDAGAAAPVYPVFQIIQSNAWAMAEKLEAANWSAFLLEQNLPVISTDSVRKEVERDLARHRSRETSIAALTDAFTTGKRSEAIAAFAKQREASEPARAAFEKHVAGDGQSGHVFHERLAQAIATSSDQARALIVEQQIKKDLSFLPGEEPLDEALVARVMEREGSPVKNLSEALSFLGDPSKVDASRLLEETESRAVERVNTAIASAQQAVQAQESLVRELETARREQLARDVAADRPVDTIVKEWTADFSKQWSKRAGDRKIRYAEPLPVTRDLINKTVRQLYDAQKQQKDALASTATPGPAPLSPSENQRDEPTEDKDKAEVEQHTKEEQLLVACDASLVIRDIGDHQCEASMRIGPDSQPILVRFAPDNAESAAHALFEGIRPALAGLVEGRQAVWKSGSRTFLGFRRKTAPELRFYMVVRSKEIRHQTSLLLRSQISALLQDWSAENHPGQPVALDWTVGLGAVVGPE